MWFTNIYLKTLREVRIAIVGWAVGIGLLLFAVLAAVPSLIATSAARASLTELAGSFAWLAEPVAITTPGGYATWKYGPTILILSLWPLLACSRLLRGEEERGSLDVLLAVPRRRGRVALEKLAAVWSALLVMGLIITLLVLAGGRAANADFGPWDALLFSLNLVLICGFFGSLALLLSQFVREHRMASGLTGGLLVIFIVLDMVHRVIPDTDWISRLSPVYYANLSKPLIPSYGTNPGALLGMLALNVLLSGLAVWLFVRRDIGSTVALPAFLRLPERTKQPAQALSLTPWSLRSLYARSLRMIAVPTCWWTLGIAGFAAWMVVIARQTENQLAALYKSSPLLRDFITKVGGGDVTTNATLLSAVFLLLPLLLMAFAVTQANRWSADEEDGRLELVLATPQPRLLVLLSRFAALTTSVVVIGLLTLAATAVASTATGLALNGGHLAAATLSIIPLGLLMAALGYLFSGWLRTALDTGLLSFLLVLWFFISFIGPDLNWSEAVLRLSAISYYGTPLLHGLPLLDMLGVLAVGALALVGASARFVRKDIGR
jgi:ABC-2 type transport system permease protein